MPARNNPEEMVSHRGLYTTRGRGGTRRGRRGGRHGGLEPRIPSAHEYLEPDRPRQRQETVRGEAGAAALNSQEMLQYAVNQGVQQALRALGLPIEVLQENAHTNPLGLPSGCPATQGRDSAALRGDSAVLRGDNA